MKKRYYILIAVVIALAALFAGAAYRVYRLTKPNVTELKNNLKIDQSQGELTLLIAGIDDVDKVHRSDTILLVRIDLDHKRIKAMSVPRDSRVYIKGHGQQKINAAYAYGGIDLLRDTVVNLTGAPVNYSAIISYRTFPKVVDALGGVDLNIEKRMVYRDRAQGLYINFKPGMQHLNGEDSLKFVRFRKDALGDVGRMHRQQQFLKAAISKVQTPSVALKVPELVSTALEFVKTDMPSESALQLALYLKDVDPSRIELFTMPGKAAYIKKLSYWIPDLRAAGEQFNTWKEEPPQPTTPSAESETVQEETKQISEQTAPTQQRQEQLKPTAEPKPTPEPQKELTKAEQLQKLMQESALAVLNGTGQAGLSKETAVRLEKLGLTVDYRGNAKHYDYHYSVVHYPAAKYKEQAIEVAKFFDIPLNLVSQQNVPKVSLVIGKDYNRLFEFLDSLLQNPQGGE